MFILKRLRTRNFLFQGFQVLIKERNSDGTTQRSEKKKKFASTCNAGTAFFTHLD